MSEVNTSQDQSAEAAAKAAAEAAKQERHNAIRAKFNNLVDVRESSFFYKSVPVFAEDGKTPLYEMKDGKPLTDKEGKPVQKMYKRPTIDQDIPVLSIEGIVAILEADPETDPLAEKKQRLLLEACADVVLARAKAFLNENESATSVPLDILDWGAIAAMPPKERKGNGIAKEVWEAWQADYIAVMVEKAGRNMDEATAASKLLMAKFQPVKTAKKVIKFLLSQLDFYIANGGKDEFSECVQFLQEKGKALLEADEASILANLGAME